MFGEIAAYAFVVVVVTGCFLMWFYEPSMKRTTYHGAYPTMRDVPMSEASAGSPVTCARTTYWIAHATGRPVRRSAPP